MIFFTSAIAIGGVTATVLLKQKLICSSMICFESSVTIDIYQGESKFLENNVKIGSFVLSGIPPCRKGEPVIYVTIKVDVNGIIEVRAREKRGNSEKDLRIKRDNLSDELIESLIKKVDKDREFIYNKVHNVMYKTVHVDREGELQCVGQLRFGLRR